MTWSFQLYSARNFEPWTDVLRALAEFGYSQVEGFGGVYGDPAALRASLDETGLAMTSGHFSIDALEKDFATVEFTATTLGMDLIACPHLAADQRPTDTAGWQAFGRRLGEAGKRVNDAGFGFAWHNHDFEFAALADGSVPQTHILEAAPDMGWEMDVAWIIRGGGDPFAWIEAEGQRITAVHVKDIAPLGENVDEDGWADVGSGTVDWPALMVALRATSARHFVMEHDNPKDAARFATRSIAAAQFF